MSKSLEDYISFLPREGQYTIDIAREESQEPLSVLSAIHWVAHHEEVEDTLGRRLIHEVNAILKRLNNSNNSTLTAKSAASLSLTPDSRVIKVAPVERARSESVFLRSSPY